MIRVHSFYQNANGVRVAAGEYADNDERLHGLADYLVETGHAERVVPPEPPPQEKSGSVAAQPPKKR